MLIDDLVLEHAVLVFNLVVDLLIEVPHGVIRVLVVKLCGFGLLPAEDI